MLALVNGMGQSSASLSTVVRSGQHSPHQTQQLVPNVIFANLLRTLSNQITLASAHTRTSAPWRMLLPTRLPSSLEDSLVERPTAEVRRGDQSIPLVYVLIAQAGTSQLDQYTVVSYCDRLCSIDQVWPVTLTEHDYSPCPCSST